MVAYAAFLRLCPDADCALPPWLVHTMRAGKVRSGGAEFDAAGGDTCGLLRLLLRYNRWVGGWVGVGVGVGGWVGMGGWVGAVVGVFARV
jgi:hypothetical protein